MLNAVLLAFTLTVGSPLAQASAISCENALIESSGSVADRAQAVIAAGQFEQGRGLADLRAAFSGSPVELAGKRAPYPFSFDSVLEVFDPKRTPVVAGQLRLWTSSGGGKKGAAVREFLKSNRNPNFRAALISFESEVKSSGRLLVKSKTRLEDIELTPQSADLVEDLFGPMAYSERPGLVLRKIVDHLKDDGIALISMGDTAEISQFSEWKMQDTSRLFGEKNKVILPSGKTVSLQEWIASLPGLEIRLYRNWESGFTFITVRIVDRKRVVIPDLVAVAISEHTQPPRYVYAVTGSVTPAARLRAASLLENQE